MTKIEQRRKFEQQMKNVGANASFLSAEHMNLRGSMDGYFASLHKQLEIAEKSYYELFPKK